MNDRYRSLATFRRDGSIVETPMWFVELNGKTYMFTDGTSHKIKRLRRESRVRTAPCTARGGIIGDWSDGTGRFVEDEALLATVYRALTQKYGWQMRLLDAASTLGGRIGRRVVIELDS